MSEERHVPEAPTQLFGEKGVVWCGVRIWTAAGGGGNGGVTVGRAGVREFKLVI